MSTTSAAQRPLSMTRTLVLDGVSKQFDTGTVALEDVDLTVGAGDFVSVVGPSGCGKSTLLRLASGLDAATTGSIEVNAHSTSYVFQEATLLEWRSALKNVELVGELSGGLRSERRAKAQEALDLVGLTGFEKQHPRQLSGGMRMRVSIARALVADPDLALFDEPFGALDEITRLHMQTELQKLFRLKEFAGLFITHSVSEAVYLSTRVLVMSGRPGRIVADIPIPWSYPRPPSCATNPSSRPSSARSPRRWESTHERARHDGPRDRDLWQGPRVRRGHRARGRDLDA
ncbi:ABC transporter ATP-binding protein [Paraoerskovia sediminicola]|uniref:ABC transporter ATP-binding protein n=1 Tax=Paraoerskovia sediminicola TaxID=1138587 RepID=UPI0025747693|nr:ABC transporter ATP-binding protein [Paraoerskovia sediminicola]